MDLCGIESGCAFCHDICIIVTELISPTKLQCGILLIGSPEIKEKTYRNFITF